MVGPGGQVAPMVGCGDTSGILSGVCARPLAGVLIGGINPTPVRPISWDSFKWVCRRSTNCSLIDPHPSQQAIRRTSAGGHIHPCSDLSMPTDYSECYSALTRKSGGSCSQEALLESWPPGESRPARPLQYPYRCRLAKQRDRGPPCLKCRRRRNSLRCLSPQTALDFMGRGNTLHPSCHVLGISFQDASFGCHAAMPVCLS
jgi:hypothetical protein